MRPTAWQWDLRRRLLDLTTLVLAVLIVALLIALGASPVVWVGVLGAVVLAFGVLAVLIGVRYQRAVDAEKAAGYSTVYDVGGFELRDGRTLDVLRTADEEPEQPGRRSLLAGMISTLRRGAS